MNKEEAIELFKQKVKKYDESVEIKGVSVGEEMRILDTVLNYIEELEEKIKVCTDTGAKLIDTKFIKNNYIPKQKIRDKIEELEKQRIKMERDDIGVGFTLGENWSNLKNKIKVLKELLEEGD